MDQAASPPPSAPRASTDAALFAVPSLIWGTTWLAIKFQLGTVAPELSVAYRFALAALMLLGFCGIRGISLRFRIREHALLALLGALLFGINYVFVYRSELYLTSGLVAVVFALMVFEILIGARLIFGTRVNGAVILGAIAGVGGVCLLFAPEVTALRTGAGQGVGIALALASTVLASAGNLLSQRLFSRGVSVIPGTAVAMGYAAVLLLGYCAAAKIPFTFDTRPAYLLSISYLATFGSGVAFVSYLTLVQRIGAGRSSYTSAVTPVIAMLVSTLFEGYRWSVSAFGGMVMVLAGTVLVLRNKASRP